MSNIHPYSMDRRKGVELRNGAPYADLIAHQKQYTESVAAYFDVAPEYIVPSAGATGAIEYVRNHVFRNHVLKERGGKPPSLLTVKPGYWRARESFEGLEFAVEQIDTESNSFSISEIEVTERARVERPNLLYLSLPNNPTGALFDAALLIGGISEETSVMVDLTLPSRELNTRTYVRLLHTSLEGRRGLFLVGSTSKSHQTAEHRIGWCLCASAKDAIELQKENRNVIAISSVVNGISHLKSGPTVLESIDQSFGYLLKAEQRGVLELIRPDRMAKAAYALIKCRMEPQRLRDILFQNDIRVMWGSEFGLSDNYIRLEMLEPANVAVFIDVVSVHCKDDQLLPKLV
jgi:aspartate/methionine/tyrosine aminotransferase